MKIKCSGFFTPIFEVPNSDQHIEMKRIRYITSKFSDIQPHVIFLYKRKANYYCSYYSSLTKLSTPSFPAAILRDKATTRAGKPAIQEIDLITSILSYYDHRLLSLKVADCSRQQIVCVGFTSKHLPPTTYHLPAIAGVDILKVFQFTV